MQVFITILILVIMIGILISMHELGHLVVAKAFNVYCFEYSIGFGPRLFHHKKKGSETDFSLRAIPLGGYVSMYGEGVDLPPGEEIPFSRSIEGISARKRILVMLAGVMVNFFLCFLFAMIYATCIPNFISAEAFDTGVTENGSISLNEDAKTANAYSLRLVGNNGSLVIEDKEYRLFAPLRLTSLSPSDIDYPYLIDDSAILNRNGEDIPVIATFSFVTVNGNNDFISNLSFYERASGYFATASQEALLARYAPDGDKQISFKEGDTFSLNLTLIPVENYDASPAIDAYQNKKTETIILKAQKIDKDIVLKGNESGKLAISIYTKWLPFGDRLLNGCYYISNFFVMIGEAFKMIFTGNFGAIGSIVAAGAQINTLTHEIGVARTFFFYGGFFSLNLAIFNLLPFPGLDGYQVLVTIIEKITHKKIPTKVKGIISYIGLGLLLFFSAFIIIRDILHLF